MRSGEESAREADRPAPAASLAPGALFERGVGHLTAHRLHEALASFDAVVAAAPDHAAAHNARGSVLGRLGRPAEAAASFERAIALNPAVPVGHNNLGLAWRDLGRLADAVAAFSRAIGLDPAYAEARYNRAVVLHEMRRLREALADYDQALALRPGDVRARYNRAVVLLTLGDLRRGFEAYRWRWRKADPPRLRAASLAPAWQGESLAGKSILVECEQGFGDSLQFIRYARLLTRMGARVTVLAPPSLTGLFRRIPEVRVEAELDGGDHDYHTPLLCVPRLLGTDLASIPAEVPYLSPDPREVARWASRLAGVEAALKVGLVWAGEPRAHLAAVHAVDRRRSLRLDQFAPLAGVSGVAFISLQKGEPAAQAARPPPGLRLTDWTDDLRDFADTAALVANLDLVITVDTAVAHLAGALARPVWILSRFDGCWRWLDGREDSPWYPTARLFHQNTPGDWAEGLERVAEALKEFVRSGAADPNAAAAGRLPG